MNRYLIPANTKKGQLILSIFRKQDLYIFVTGITLSFLLLLIFQGALNNTVIAVLCVLPGLLGSFLCIPIPNYHNVLRLIIEIYDYFTTENKLKWRGWCFLDGTEKK